MPDVVAARRWRDGAVSLVLAGPAVALFVVMLVIPIGLSGYLSLTNWDGYSANPDIVGLANYVKAFSSTEVGQAAFVTIVLASLGTLLLNLIGLGLAMLLNGPSRTNRLLRLVFFYPHVLSALVIGFLWAAILGTNGAVNSLLAGGGRETLPFLSDPTWALGTLVAVVVWSGFGVNLVLYLAGLQSVPSELVEAARIDGAGQREVFRNVTLPVLRPTITVNLVLSLVILLKTYDVVVSLTGGGPAGRTQTAAYLILADSFNNNQLGFGSAQAVILMLVTAVLALSVIRMRSGSDMAAFR